LTRLAAAPDGRARGTASRRGARRAGSGPGAGTGTAGGPARRPATGRGTSRRLGRWRLPLTLIALIVLGGTAIALLASPARPNSYLDPASTAPSGANALTDLLGERGAAVIRAYNPADALAALVPATAGRAGLVVTSPGLLTRRQLRSLARADADLLLVGADGPALALLAPGVRVARARPAPPALARPRCALAGARVAGSADVGGLTYATARPATGCYPLGGHPWLVRYAIPGRAITVVGGGGPMTNVRLARGGDAALALNLLAADRRVVWLTPEPAATGPATAGPPGRPALIPPAAWLAAIQLGIAALLAAAWRARRFGPLISERLPVVVRACETVEGHGRLYRARRARDRAAAALREAALARLRPALGLPRNAPAPAVAGALADRTALSRRLVAALLCGPAPASDTDLVRLARNLDDLEKGARSP